MLEKIFFNKTAKLECPVSGKKNVAMVLLDIEAKHSYITLEMANSIGLHCYAHLLLRNRVLCKRNQHHY